MTVQSERERLLQNKNLACLKHDQQLSEMVIVYLSESTDLHSFGIYCALIPSSNVEKALSNNSWDLSFEGGLPGAVTYYKGDTQQVEYLRFGEDSGVEPLVIMRDFYGIREDYMELSEEFRLFHRLYHDKKTDQYIKIDEAGNEHLIAIVQPACVQIRLKELRQFLAIKEMHLSIQFDYREHSEYTLEDLQLKGDSENKKEGLICWVRYFGDGDGICSYNAFSRLLGKRLIPPLSKSKSGFWGFAEEPEKKHVEFIIGINDEGEEIEHSSNPDTLANNFGANPGEPHYLTPVQFRKQVLDKYYQQPSKYSVEDSVLRCGGLWSVYIDNHHADKVCVWLGDLGRDLSYEEQLHWRAYNIIPDGGVSDVYFKRQIMAQFTDSVQPEHIFKQRYQDLQEACEKLLGWQLLLPLSSNDVHCYQSIRIPAIEEQRDFDSFVLGVTKVMIDALNERELNKLIPVEQQTDLKGGIFRLETFFAVLGVQDAEEHISFMRKLQNLRSSGAAHLKGSNYRKIAEEFGFKEYTLRAVSESILRKAINLIEFFIAVIHSGKIKEN